jgi:hypothetical protein
MLSIKKIKRRRNKKSKSLKLIHKRKSLKNHKKIIGGQMFFDDRSISNSKVEWRRLGKPEDLAYNCVAHVFRFLGYANDEVCNELGQIRSKYGFIGISCPEIERLLENCGETEFIKIIGNDDPNIGQTMIENLTRFLLPGHATLASIIVDKDKDSIAHCFAIMRRPDMSPNMMTPVLEQDMFLAIDPQIDPRLEYTCSLGEYLLKHTFMLTAKYYGISILQTELSPYDLPIPFIVTMENVRNVFPLPMVASAIAPLMEGDWNERRAKFGLPPLRQRQHFHGEAAGVSEEELSDATDRTLSFIFPQSPLPQDIPKIPELQHP